MKYLKCIDSFAQPLGESTKALIIVICLLSLKLNAKGQHIGLNNYTNQSEIKASGSVTLMPGFHAPSGSNVRIFIESTLPSFQECVPSAWSPNSNQNYIRTRIFKVAGVNAGNIDASRTTCEVNQVVQYYDGLGRRLQEVTVQGSPLFKDLVQPFAYDAFGRETTKYLPYADVSGAANGSYKSNALTSGQGVGGFYSSPPSGVKGTAFPFSVSVIEPSPLNRVLEQGAPGQTWQPSGSRTTSAGRTIASEYVANLSTDNVRFWTVTGNGATGTTYYSPNRLYKYIIKDENWGGSGKSGTAEEYKDLEGRIVLKRVWQTESVSLSTYYVYDDLGNLRYVLPPAVSGTSFVDNDAVFNNYIYGYKYDGRSRVVEKKIPGKGWEYLVYNKLDQVVMTQDAVQRSKASQEWTVSKYDVYGRVVITGIYTHSGSGANTAFRTNMQTSVNNQLSQWENKSSSGDGYTTNLTYPTTALSSTLSVMYYDDYTPPLMPYNYSSSYSNMTKGLATASKTLVLGTTSSYLWSVNYYDDEGRVVKLYKQHYQGGSPNVNNYDEITNTYNFAGDLTGSTRSHKVGAGVTTIATRYEYDHMGRKRGVFEKINTGAEVVLSKLDYNEIGQLTKKSLHSTDGVGFLQNTKYGYNERGWLKRNISNEFSMKLGYDTLGTPQYNGNIATQEWGSGFANKFLYGYDKLNRLINGTSSGTVMSEVVTYDVMGNIATLNRDGVGVGTYNYTGNKLNSISGGGLASGSYAYDLNGNATNDGRTGITLGYNMLNLPSAATKTGLNLAYTYDASGNKLRKVNSTLATTRHYIDGIEYNGNTIDIIHTEEGVARNNAGSYSYEYNLTDHLGNVRYTFNKHPTTGLIQQLQTDNYYAFGKQKVATAGTNKYLYNGKELQEELGQLDYGARFYDPVIGRWNVVDPLAEEMRRYSPYAYVYNNPLRFVDPDGMKGEDWVEYELEGKSYVKWDENVIDQRSAINLYGASALYVGRDGTAYTKEGYKIHLNSDKRWTYDAPVLGPSSIGPSLSESIQQRMPVLNLAEGITTLSAIVASGAVGATGSAGNFLINGVGRRAALMNGLKLAEARALGVAGEAAVGVSAVKDYITVAGRTRIPDILTKTTIEEVKNVRYQSFTRQLRDFYQHSQDKGLDFILHTRSSTKISKPLQTLIDQRKIIHQYIPGL